ncbi:hypothetical protein WUBG_12175, partial [Wuchereria bancrofti]
RPCNLGNRYFNFRLDKHLNCGNDRVEKETGFWSWLMGTKLRKMDIVGGRCHSDGKAFFPEPPIFSDSAKYQ